MSFEEEVAKLGQEGTIGVAWLVGDDLKVYFNFGEWNVDPLIPFNAWKNQNHSIDFGGGLKFTVITMTPERLISTNLGGQGHICIARCPKWNGCVVVWSPKDVEKNYAYASTARLAAKVGG
ncbi:MAG: hypothetical protein KAS52_06155 [Candidatus Heimdallarchaeota archaeon]|nr:hypothetical protein [Candidatus Heimdallarchaeota archaeon]